MTMYFDLSAKAVLTLDDMRKNYEEIIADGDTQLESFEEYLETAIEWQDVIEIDEQDMETLKSEKCYFCKDSAEILSESELKKGYEMNAYGMDFDSYEEFISAVTAPWESLIEMN